MAKGKNFFKKLFVFGLVLALAVASLPITMYANDNSVQITQHTFTDELFRNYVSQFDLDNDKVLSKDEIAKVTVINVSGKGIKELAGIGYFTSLKTLDCSYNELTTLNLSGCTSLKKVDCSNNKITWLSASDCANLEELNCSYNEFQSLNLYGNSKLKVFNCSNNKITWITVSGFGELEEFDCSNNTIKTLDLSNNVNLKKLVCSNNDLITLDVTNSKNIETVECTNDNYFMDLTYSPNQYWLYNLNFANFDFNRASNWQGADVVDAYGNGMYYLTNFTPVNGRHAVTFDYDIGNGLTVTFALNYKVLGDGVGESLAGFTVSLNDYISVNFYMELSDTIAKSETAHMAFVFSDGLEEDVYVSEAEVVKDCGKTYYVFPCKVAAKEMVCDIQGQMVDGDQSGKIYTYTVQDYAEQVIGETNSKITDAIDASIVAKSMLNYGGYAQLYFNHKTEDLAHDSVKISDEEKNLISSISAETLEQYKVDSFPSNEYVRVYGTSVVFKTRTILRVYFYISKGVNVDDVIITCGEKTLDKKKSGSYYYVDVEDIAAKDLDKMFTINVNYEDTNLEINYGVLSYCYTVLNRETTATCTQELKDTVAALYLYNQAAKAYFD